MPPNRKSATVLSSSDLQGFASLSGIGVLEHAPEKVDEAAADAMKRVDSSYWKEVAHAPNQQDTYWTDPAAAHATQQEAKRDDSTTMATTPDEEYHPAPFGMMHRADSYWKEDPHATGQIDSYWNVPAAVAAHASAVAAAQPDEQKSDNSTLLPSSPQPEEYHHPAAPDGVIMKRVDSSYWKEDSHDATGQQETYWTDPAAAHYQHAMQQQAHFRTAGSPEKQEQQQQEHQVSASASTGAPAPAHSTPALTLVDQQHQHHHPAPESTMTRINSYWKEEPHSPSSDDVYWTESSESAAASAQQQEQQV
jgi:hypothetical protein